VFGWDITKLADPAKGKHSNCCVMVDIYSRSIVGAKVHVAESGMLVVEMMTNKTVAPLLPIGRTLACVPNPCLKR